MSSVSAATGRGAQVNRRGEAVQHPRHSRTAERRLATARHRLARRKTRSTRWYQAPHLAATTPQQVRRHRGAAHHTTAQALVRQYDRLYPESVPVATVGRTTRGPADPPPGHQHARCRLGSVPHHPHAPAGMRREARGSGRTRVHHAGRLGMWRARAHIALGAYPELSCLRLNGGLRAPCCAEPRSGQAARRGAVGVGPPAALKQAHLGL